MDVLEVEAVLVLQVKEDLDALRGRFGYEDRESDLLELVTPQLAFEVDGCRQRESHVHAEGRQAVNGLFPALLGLAVHRLPSAQALFEGPLPRHGPSQHPGARQERVWDRPGTQDVQPETPQQQPGLTHQSLTLANGIGYDSRMLSYLHVLPNDSEPGSQSGVLGFTIGHGVCSPPVSSGASHRRRHHRFRPDLPGKLRLKPSNQSPAPAPARASPLEQEQE